VIEYAIGGGGSWLHARNLTEYDPSMPGSKTFPLAIRAGTVVAVAMATRGLLRRRSRRRHGDDPQPSGALDHSKPGDLELYAAPRGGVRLEDCDFYHCVDLPGIGEVVGMWDLRGHEDEYLGYADLAGRRVLEIGPASGFLTLALERAGATVVAVDTAPDAPWDFVPQAGLDMATITQQRRRHMERIRNSWWLVHERCRLQAQVHYGNGAVLPDGLGRFDVAVLAAVLLHCRNPLVVLENAAQRADTLVVTDLVSPDLAGPVCRLVPSRENAIWDTWWALTPEIVDRYLQVLGFGAATVTYHTQELNGIPHPLFTLVSSR